MLRKSQDINLVAFSVRMYQLLLKAYPAKFQQEYGPHMVQVFQDCCLRTVRQGGRRGLFMLWALTFLDFIRSVFEQHLQKETEMSKSKFIKLSGWAFVVGSFAFISIQGGSVTGAVVSSILIAIGMLGLRVRYGERAGSLGRNSLLIGVAGMALTYASVPLLREVEVFQLRLPWDSIPMDFLPFAGPAVLLTGLSVFGLVALIRKPLPHLNWLPLLAGIGYPVIYFSVFISISMNNNGVWPENSNFYFIVQMGIMVQFLALCILGMILQSDAPEEVYAPA
jgi:hypothetical protein